MAASSQSNFFVFEGHKDSNTNSDAIFYREAQRKRKICPSSWSTMKTIPPHEPKLYREGIEEREKPGFLGISGFVTKGLEEEFSPHRDRNYRREGLRATPSAWDP